MHLQPAKYTSTNSRRLPATANANPNDQSTESSSPRPLDTDNGGNGNISSNNNNQQSRHYNQFTVSGQFYSQSDAINASQQLVQFGSQQQSAKPANSLPVAGERFYTALDCLPIGRQANFVRKTPQQNRPTDSFGFAIADGGQGDMDNNRSRKRAMEMSIVNMVEMSALAAKDEDFSRALERAQEAKTTLESLRSIASSSAIPKHSNERPLARKPITTDTNLFALTTMVESNLAERLRNNGSLSEAMEVYTQLCKRGISTGASSLLDMDEPNGHLEDARLLLCRFGMNIGNILCDLNEHQRALKYYRLTLDRLATVSGQRNLRLKLMNNISIALMHLQEQQEHRQQYPGGLDAIASLNLLLKDNLFPRVEANGRQSGNRKQPNETPTCVHNANHHRFALNLMVSLYMRNNLSAMMDTFRGLVRVDVCRHYERLSDISGPDRAMGGSLAHAKGGRPTGDDNEQQPPARQTARQVMSGLGATQTGASRSATNMDVDETSAAATFPAPPTVIGDGRGRTDIKEALGQSAGGDLIVNTNNEEAADWATATASASVSSASVPGHRRAQTNSLIAIKSDEKHELDSLDHDHRQTADGPSSTLRRHNKQQMTNPSSGGLAAVSVGSPGQLVCSTESADRLEMLIGERHRQISRCLIMTCRLIFELDGRTRAPAEGERPTGTRVGLDTTSAFHSCVKLLKESKIYENLAPDVRTIELAQLLVQRNKLDGAIGVLKEVADDMQLNGQQHSRPLMGSLVSSSPSQVAHLIGSPSAVTTNSCLLHLLQRQISKAIDQGDRALSSDPSNVHALINLANSYYYSGQLDTAETLCRDALFAEPSNWQIAYNLTLVGRKLGRSLDELGAAVRICISNHRKSTTAAGLNSAKMLPMVQLALISLQSGQRELASAAIKDLMSKFYHSPEVSLIASKLEEISEAGDSTKSAAINILVQAHNDHPYHLPIVERLIALHINHFNYKEAIELIEECVLSRPNEARWQQMLAECHRRAADYGKAISIYKAAVDSFPQDTNCLKALIKLTDELGIKEETGKYEQRLERTLKLISATEN